jgi:tRNA threonylcarbamoyladenosine modification (KEOPS) complex Cgi121 subunit
MLNDKKLHIEFLKELRSDYPHLILQALHFQFILGVNHAKKILAISLHAEKNKALLSKKIEVDILLRFAGTTQISRAIKIAGRKPNKDFFIIAIGKKSTLNKLHSELKLSLSQKQFSKSNHQYLKKQFKISKKQTSTISSKNPLEDIIAEKAVLLF